MISTREALTRAADQLAINPLLRPTALLDAALLLQHLLGLDRAQLRAHPERPLTRDQLAAYQSLLTRRLAFEPIQYITGEQEFYGLPFRVTPATLIPRPETELLVEAVLSRVPPRAPIQPTRILDLGTGSGAIAVALAHHLPQAHITALDLSPAALAVARDNATRNGVAGRIAFFESDLFTAVAHHPPYDCIVSNPPYVPLDDELHPQVRDHEPHTALFAGPDGLTLYQRLIPQAWPLLVPGGLLALEFGHGQRDALAHLLTRWFSLEFLPDLQGIPRVALARRP